MQCHPEKDRYDAAQVYNSAALHKAANPYQIIAFGGFGNTHSNATAATDVFFSAGDSWQPGTPLATPRIAFGAAHLPCGNIFLTGGHDRGMRRQVEEYHVAARAWTPAAPLPRHERVFQVREELPALCVALPNGGMPPQ